MARIADKPANALVIGYDYRIGDDPKGSRSDTLMLIRADPGTETETARIAVAPQRGLDILVFVAHLNLGTTELKALAARISDELRLSQLSSRITLIVPDDSNFESAAGDSFVVVLLFPLPLTLSRAVVILVFSLPMTLSDADGSVRLLGLELHLERRVVAWLNRERGTDRPDRRAGRQARSRSGRRRRPGGHPETTVNLRN